MEPVVLTCLVLSFSIFTPLNTSTHKFPFYPYPYQNSPVSAKILPREPILPTANPFPLPHTTPPLFLNEKPFQFPPFSFPGAKQGPDMRTERGSMTFVVSEGRNEGANKMEEQFEGPTHSGLKKWEKYLTKKKVTVWKSEGFFVF
jgi:hypothetical protein